MIVDAHVHIVPDRVLADVAAVVAADRWFADCHATQARLASVETLLAAMDNHGIDRAVCLGWPFADAALCAESNDYIAAAQRRHPDRIIGFGIVQPNDHGAVAEVERCARLGLRGIGELNADAQSFALTDQHRLEPLVAASVRCNLVWNLHCSEPVGHLYPGKGTATPGPLAEFASNNPDLTLVLAHLGGGLPFYAHMPEVHELCRRLWFDTAAQPYLYTPSVYRTIVDSLGADRILFGSDHPLLNLPRYRTALDESGIPAAAVDAILGDNARRLFGEI